ncbi:MAG: outer membrane protein assembly factor BamA, partial [Verrucomicrobiaceae bacterium]|nr:outer membrane protein assembly factor BamA [Verrucomicrobiaceae bacterium]
MIGLPTLRVPLIRSAACVIAIASLHLGTAYSQLSDRAAAANAPAAKRIVKEIKVEYKGAVSVSEARVRDQMSTREGEAYSDESVEQDIRSLYATGAVDNVEIKAENVAGGVRVVVIISGRGSIGEINFQGNSIYDSKKLLKETEVKTGEPVDEAKLAKAAQAIRDKYEKSGYADVSVSYHTAPLNEAGFTRVTFTIAEGARGLVRNINFEGNTALKSAYLRGKMTLKEKALYRVWRGKSGRLTDEGLADDRKAVEAAYHDKGYTYAKVIDVKRQPVGSDYVDLTFIITEGAKYDVSEVVLEGITVFTVPELTRALKTVKGFAYSGADVHDDEKMIGDYYGSRGYADARVETSIIPVGANAVKVVYHLTEGEKSFIGRVNIAGNSVTKDNVIRRELPFSPGE